MCSRRKRRGAAAGLEISDFLILDRHSTSAIIGIGIDSKVIAVYSATSMKAFSGREEKD
jgi:hypothetical protein